MQVNTRRLYRSRQDRQLAGVAAGMAEYLDVDPTVVRILWILAGLFSGGLLILAYIILAFVIPEAPFTGATNPGWNPPTGAAPSQGWTAPAGTPPGQGWGNPAPAAPQWGSDWQAHAAAERRARGRGPGGALIVGTILVVFGVIALADSVIPAWAGAVVFGPALVIALGAALLVASVRRRDGGSAAAAGFGQAAYAAPAGGAAQPSQPSQPSVARAPAADDADATSQVDLTTGIDPQRDTDAR